MTLAKNVLSASPPIHAWMPNQPHATIARISAGRFDPIVPYAARAKTGNGMPYFVPGCELSRIGIEHDRVAEHDREERLPPVHAGRDQPRRQHVGRDAVRHADPQRRVVVGRPVAPRDRHRREVVVVERARLDARGSRSSTRPSGSSIWLGGASVRMSVSHRARRCHSPAGARLGPRLRKRPAPFLPTNCVPLDDDLAAADDRAAARPATTVPSYGL